MTQTRHTGRIRSAPRAHAGSSLRQTGVDVVGEAPWGTHFCQFYANQQDLTDVLVPYMKAGLEADECCMWVTSPPLGVEEAWAALATAVPDLETYRQRGRIEIIPHTAWYLLGGQFDQDRVLAGWVRKLDEALARGCAGLRLSGNTFWLERSDWRSFAEYEAAIDAVLGQYRMLALCTYSVDRCGASEVADVIRNHEFALIKRDGRWEVFESFERRRMQDALAAERERLAVTLHSIGDAVIATDTEGRVTTINRSAEQLTGWSEGEALGKPVEEVFRLVGEEPGPLLEHPVRTVLERATRADVTGRAALLARDGRRIEIADSAAPIRGRGGATLGAVLVFRDVTAERRVEAALRENEQRARLKLERILSPEGDIGSLELADIIDAPALQALMEEFYELAHIPMAVIDLRGNVLVGVGWQDICTRFHRQHPETHRHCIESDTQLSAGVPEGEFKLYKCKNNMWDVATPLVVGGQHVGNVFMGQFFFDDERIDYDGFRAQASRYGFAQDPYLAALDAVPRLSRQAVAAGMAFFLGIAAMLSKLSYSNLTLARSITEREALMRSLRESKDSLEAADRRKDEFLAMLSHELRNPLAPVRNSVYLLRHAGADSERARRALSVIERQTGHLTRLVDDLLDVTRIARGKIELRRERVDLREVVGHAGEDFRSMLDDRGLAFRVVLPASALFADADPARVTQVIGNLLHNAAKFTPPGGEVSLSLRPAEGAAEIRVRDTGAGIDATLLGHVFDPFVQGERTLARGEGGLGLGLALVKGVAELHGGTVRAESRGAGRGAEFIVALPGARGEPVRRWQDGRDAEVGRPRSRRRVLVVDDNADAAASLAEIVELFGHVVDVAHDGPSAVEKAREIAPDVVLCDIGLPGMNGYEVAKALRASGAAVQLVAMSGYAQDEDVRMALEAGFDVHVAKPCDPDRIEQLLARGLGGGRA